MAAQPKKKISRVRGRTRRAHSKISLPKLGKCSNCGHLKPPHIACPECGFYGKKKVLITKTDKRIAQKLKADKAAASVNKKESLPKTDKKSDTSTTTTKPEEEDKK